MHWVIRCVFRGDTAVIRTDFNGYIESDPAAWINPILYSLKPEDIQGVIFNFNDGKSIFTRVDKDKKFNDKDNPWLEDLLQNLSTLRIIDAQAKGNPSTETAFKEPKTITFKLFTGKSITTTWTRESNAETKETKCFVRVTHSDAENKINRLNEKADFLCPSWLSDQIPISFADLNKRLNPPAETTK
jgi:hypothetical protein